MADLFENPMGLCGFEFVEFASPTPNLLEPLFEKWVLAWLPNIAQKMSYYIAKGN